MAGWEVKRERSSGRILISKLRLQGTSVSEVGMLVGWGVLHGSSPFTYKHLFGCFLFFSFVVVWVFLGGGGFCFFLLAVKFTTHILHCITLTHFCLDGK